MKETSKAEQERLCAKCSRAARTGNLCEECFRKTLGQPYDEPRKPICTTQTVEQDGWSAAERAKAFMIQFEYAFAPELHDKIFNALEHLIRIDRSARAPAVYKPEPDIKKTIESHQEELYGPNPLNRDSKNYQGEKEWYFERQGFREGFYKGAAWEYERAPQRTRPAEKETKDV